MSTEDPADARFCAVLLAAGESKRFGSPKQLLEIDGEALIRRLARALDEGGVQEVVVVLGAHVEAPQRALAGLPCRIVEHAGWQRGMISSFQAGLRAGADPRAHLLLVPGDLALLRASHVRALLDAARPAFAVSPASPVLLPCVDGKRGHPVIFHRALRQSLLALSDQAPLHDFVRMCPDLIEMPALDDAYLFNLNRPEDLARLR